MAINIGTLEGILSLRTDGMDSAVRNVGMSVADLRKKLQELAKTPGLRIDAAESAKHTASIKGQTRALEENLLALKKGPAAVAALRNEREIMNRLLSLGIARESVYGKQIETQIRLQQRLRSEIEQQERLYKKLGSAVGSLAKMFGALGVTLSAGVLLRQSLTEAIEASNAFTRLKSVLQSTGGTVGYTAQELDALAESLSRVTGIDDDVIVGAEAMMLRYTRLTGDTFPKAIELAIDMASAQGQQITSTEQLASEVENLGRKLGDPMRAAMMLKREGRGLSEEQYKLLLNFKKTNDFAGQQSVILKHLQTIYGGTARSLRQEVGGAIQATRTAWNNLLEAFGEGLLVDTTGVNDLADTLSDPTLQQSVKDLGAGFGEIAGNLAELVKYIGPLVSGLIQIEQHISPLQQLGKLLGGSGKKKDNIYGPFTPLGQSSGRGGKSSAPADPAAIKAAEELAEKYADVKEGLAEVTKQAIEMAEALQKGSQAEIQALVRTHALRSLYLRDVDQFGKRAAESLRSMRAADYDAAKVAEEANKTWQERLDIIAETGDEMVALFEKDQTEMFDLIAETGDEMVELWQKDQEEIRQAALGAIAEVGDDMVAAWEAYIDQLASDFRSLSATITAELQTPKQSLDAWYTAITTKAKEALDKGVTTQKKYQETVLKIEELYGRKRLEINQQTFDDLLSNLDSALGFLSDRFGGFFKHLQELVNGIQQAQGFGKAVSGIAEGLGAAKGAASAIGGVAGVVAIFAVVFDIVDKLIKAKRMRDYETGIEYEIINAQESIQALSYAEKAAVKAIRSVVENIESALRISILSMSELGLKIRRDGERFKAYFQGELLGVFHTMEEAIQIAFQAAFSDPTTVITGLSDLMRQALSEANPAGDFEDLISQLERLREVSDLGLSDTMVQLQVATRRFDELRHALRQLDEVTPAVIEGYSNLVAAELRATQAYADSLMGRERTREQQLADKQAEARMFLAEGKMRIANLRLEMVMLEAAKEHLRARGTLITGSINLDGIVINSYGNYLKAKGELVKAELTLNEMELAAIEAAIAAIAALIPELEQILAGVDPDKVKLPRLSGRGAGAGAGDNIRNMIEDVNRQVAQFDMSDYARQIDDVNRKWNESIASLGNVEGAEARARRARDEAIRAANGNAEAIRRANEAYDRAIHRIGATREEIEAANRAREAEINLISQQRIADVVGQFRDFLGLIDPFDQIRQTAEDLIKSIEDSPMGDERKAGMIERVLAGMNEQIEKLAKESALGLFGELVGDLQKYGASNELIHEAQVQMAILEHGLKMAHYQAEFEILKAQGVLSEEVLAAMGHAIDFLGGINPADFVAPVVDVPVREFTSAVNDTADALDKLKEEFQRAKDGIKEFLNSIRRGDLGIVAPEAAFKAAQSQYQEMLAKAASGQLEGFQGITESARNYIEALKRFSPALAAVELPKIESALEALSNAPTVKDDNLIYTQLFTEAKKTNTVLESGFTTLNQAAMVNQGQQSDIISALDRMSANQAELNARLARLESGETGNKRSVAVAGR